MLCNAIRFAKLAGAVAVLALSAALVSCGQSEAGREPEHGFETARVVHVIDGDTLYVDVAGEGRKVRLIGIDCPESVAADESRNVPEGKEASAFTESVVPEGMEVYLQRDVSETDKYGRYLYYVWLEMPDDPADPDEAAQKMLNAVIVGAGYAQAKRFPPDTAYAETLEQAQALAIEKGAGVSALWI